MVVGRWSGDDVMKPMLVVMSNWVERALTQVQSLALPLKTIGSTATTCQYRFLPSFPPFEMGTHKLMTSFIAIILSLLSGFEDIWWDLRSRCLVQMVFPTHSYLHNWDSLRRWWIGRWRVCVTFNFYIVVIIWFQLNMMCVSVWLDALTVKSDLKMIGFVRFCLSSCFLLALTMPRDCHVLPSFLPSSPAFEREATPASCHNKSC